MSICRNLPRYEFGTKRGGGCDVSFFQAAGNMGVITWQLGCVLFCIAYKVVHQPFFGLKISSHVLTAFAIHYHKERTCLESSGWLFFEPFRLCIYYCVYMGPTPGRCIQVGVEQWFYKQLRELQGVLFLCYV